MNQQIAHIALVVNDYDEAIHFYTGKLNFTLIEDAVISETKRWVLVAPPGSDGCNLLLAKATADEQKSRIGNQTGGRVFLFLNTDNFWRDYKNMLAEGIIFVREPVIEPYGIVAVFKDLYGNLWDLIEPKKNMLFREARLTDIPQIQMVRNAVTENTLSDPALVSNEDVADYIIRRGKGWVCEVDNRIVGFAIADLEDHNIWALFIQPGFDKKGIGRKLHDDMLNWYCTQTSTARWLSTSPGTRAEQFYRQAGWIETGIHGKGEIKFEMTAAQWKLLR